MTMNCLGNLVQCRFLKNIGKELVQARSVVAKDDVESLPVRGYKPIRKKESKRLYSYYIERCGFANTFGDIDPNDKTMMYYLQDGNIVWMASRTKSIIDQTKLDSVTTNGDIPLYSGKQFIQNKLFFVVMYDLTFYIQPITTN